MRGLITAITVLAATTAHAQDNDVGEVGNGTAFGNWEVACDAVTTQRVTCRLVQTQALSETNALLLRMIVFSQPEGGALVTAQMPMGVYLPGGAVFRAETDEEAPVTGMVWQRCLGQVCEAAIALDGEAVDALVESGSILFAYQMNPGEDRRIVRVDVSTLGDGLAAIQP